MNSPCQTGLMVGPTSGPRACAEHGHDGEPMLPVQRTVLSRELEQATFRPGSEVTGFQDVAVVRASPIVRLEHQGGGADDFEDESSSVPDGPTDRPGP